MPDKPSMKIFLEEQYKWVTSSRVLLLSYAAQLSAKDFVSSSPAFARGSVRNLLVHVCDTYRFWIAGHALKEPQAFRPYEYYTNLEQCRLYFETADRCIKEFIGLFAGDYLSGLPVARKDGVEQISPLQLFTHVITHEFHHKGQIMSLSRDLGYTPVDADIIR